MTQNPISNPLRNSQLTSIHELVDNVGKRQLQDFGQINSDIKPDGTLITECDRWSDKTIVQGLDKIANGEGDELGDISTLLNPEVVHAIKKNVILN